MPTKLTLVTQLYPRGILLILLKFQILAKCGLEYLLFSQHGILLNNNIVYPDLKAEEPVILNTERSRRLNYKVFKKYAPVNEAIEQFLSAYQKNCAPTQKPQQVSLQEAANRVLAKDFTVPIDIPRFNRLAMDGYAVLASDTKGATQKQPVTLEVRGRTYAGDSSTCKICIGQAVAVATGARIPAGVDAVVTVEYTAEAEGAKKVQVFKEIEKGKNVAVKGEDIHGWQ
jgi:hypothetical protein